MSKQIQVAFPIGALVSLVFMGSGAALAGDSWLGTWKVNLAKSRYSAGAPPRSNTATYEAWEGGLKASTDGVSADGQPTHTEFAAKYDGKDYPYKGSPTLDAVSLKRIDDNTYEATMKYKGKAMLTSRNVISKDGKTRTQTLTGTDARGRAVSNIVVFDRQ